MQRDDIARDYFRELSSKYPPELTIKMVAEILDEKCPAIRARIRRGTFQVRVRHSPGNPQKVLLVDLFEFWATGESQIPLNTQKSNLKSKYKRRGRPRQSSGPEENGAL